MPYVEILKKYLEFNLIDTFLSRETFSKKFLDKTSLLSCKTIGTRTN